MGSTALLLRTNALYLVMASAIAFLMSGLGVRIAGSASWMRTSWR